MDLLYESSSDDSEPAAAAPAEPAAEPAPAPASAPPALLFNPVAGDWPCLVFLRVPAGAQAAPRRLAAALALSSLFRGLAVRSLCGVEERGAAEGAGAGAGADGRTVAADAADAARSERASALHVSLSRNFSLRRHQIAPFVAELRAALARAAAPARRPFAVTLAPLPTVLVNETRSRAFVALRAVEAGAARAPPSAPGALDALVTAVDSALAAFGRPAYYAGRRLHVSVASVEGGAAAARAAERAGLDVEFGAFAGNEASGAAAGGAEPRGGARAEDILRVGGASAVPPRASARGSEPAAGSARPRGVDAVEQLLLAPRERPDKRPRLQPQPAARDPGAAQELGSASPGSGSGPAPAPERAPAPEEELADVLAAASAAPPAAWLVEDVCLRVGDQAHVLGLG